MTDYINDAHRAAMEHQRVLELMRAGGQFVPDTPPVVAPIISAAPVTPPLLQPTQTATGQTQVTMVKKDGTETQKYIDTSLLPPGTPTQTGYRIAETEETPWIPSMTAKTYPVPAAYPELPTEPQLATTQNRIYTDAEKRSILNTQKYYTSRGLPIPPEWDLLGKTSQQRSTEDLENRLDVTGNQVSQVQTPQPLVLPDNFYTSMPAQKQGHDIVPMTVSAGKERVTGYTYVARKTDAEKAAILAQPLSEEWKINDYTNVVKISPSEKDVAKLQSGQNLYFTVSPEGDVDFSDKPLAAEGALNYNLKNEHIDWRSTASGIAIDKNTGAMVLETAGAGSLILLDPASSGDSGLGHITNKFLNTNYGLARSVFEPMVDWKEYDRLDAEDEKNQLAFIDWQKEEQQKQKARNNQVLAAYSSKITSDANKVAELNLVGNPTYKPADEIFMLGTASGSASPKWGNVTASGDAGMTDMWGNKRAGSLYLTDKDAYYFVEGDNKGQVPLSGGQYAGIPDFTTKNSVLEGLKIDTSNPFGIPMSYRQPARAPFATADDSLKVIDFISGFGKAAETKTCRQRYTKGQKSKKGKNSTKNTKQRVKSSVFEINIGKSSRGMSFDDLITIKTPKSLWSPVSLGKPPSLGKPMTLGKLTSVTNDMKIGKTLDVKRTDFLGFNVKQRSVDVPKGIKQRKVTGVSNIRGRSRDNIQNVKPMSFDIAPIKNFGVSAKQSRVKNDDKGKQKRKTPRLISFLDWTMGR
jgi:hypothetical protein